MLLALNYSDYVNQWCIVIVASLVAAVCDILTRRIPNRLTIPMAVLGMVHSYWMAGWGGLGEAVIAMGVLAAPFFIMFALGYGGGGDVKMMGAIGAWLGLRQGLIVLILVCIVGGLLALARIATLKERRTLFRNLLATLYILLIALVSGRRGWKLLKADPEEQSKALTSQATIPYGVAMFMGVCLGAGLVYYKMI